MSPLIYFVTPAWQRYDLTRVVLEQRRHVAGFLAERGVEARTVVIADDLNAEIAEELGWEVRRTSNDTLGRRFNDGIEHAARQGADWIVPIGSDSFIDPAYLFPLPGEGVVRSATLCSIAEPGRLGRLKIRRGFGVAPFMIPRSHLPASLRPANEWRKRGIDGSTIQGLRRGWKLEFNDFHPWQQVAFRGQLPQLNSYDKLYRRYGVGQEPEVVERLSEYYPTRLVERALAACAPVKVAA